MNFKKIILLSLIFLLIGCSPKQNNVNEQITDEELTAMVINYDMGNENIDYNFLKWVYSEYGF